MATAGQELIGIRRWRRSRKAEGSSVDADRVRRLQTDRKNIVEDGGAIGLGVAEAVPRDGDLGPLGRRVGAVRAHLAQDGAEDDAKRPQWLHRQVTGERLGV